MGRTGAYELGNVAAHFYLEADLRARPPRFNAALVALVERHDMLRAVVSPDGRQKILAEVPPYRDRDAGSRRAPGGRGGGRPRRLRRRMSHQVLPTDRWPLFEIRASLLSGGRVRLHMSFDS